MPIAIAGMHRSGTSMVAKLLHVGGVYLGPPSELDVPAPDNADGLWEDTRFVGLNDDILRAFGGGWDSPPALPQSFRGEPFEHIRPAAETLVAEVRANDPWGWKDPRNSLTLPFWRSVVDDLFTVVCVRNPIEVAISLHRRNSLSYSLSIALWDEYNRRLLASTTPDRRFVTHYAAFFEDARGQVERLLAAVGRPATDELVERCVAATNVSLRHTIFTNADLLEAEVAPDTLALYAQLCDEAAWVDGGKLSLPQTTRSRGLFRGRRQRGQQDAQRVNEDVIEIKVLREAHRLGLAGKAELEEHISLLQSELATLGERLVGAQTRLAQRDAAAATLQASLQELQEHSVAATAAIEDRDETIKRLQADLVEVTDWAYASKATAEDRDATVHSLTAELGELRARLESAESELRGSAETIREREEALAALTGELEQLRAEAAAAATELERVHAELAEVVSRRDVLAGEVERIEGLLQRARGDLARLLAQAQRVSGLEAELEIANAELVEKRGLLAARDEEIVELAARSDEAVERERAAAGAMAAQLEDVVRERTEEVARLEAALADERARADAGLREIEARDANLRDVQTRFEILVADRDDTIRRLQQDVAEVSDHAHAMVRDVALRDGSIRQLQSDLAAAEADAAAANATVAEQEERLHALEAELEDAREQLDAGAADLAAARGELEAAAVAISERDERIRELEAELAELRERVDAEGTLLAVARGEAEAAAAEAQWQAGRIRELETEIADAARAAGDELDALRRRLRAKHQQTLEARRRREKKLRRRLRTAGKRSKQTLAELSERDQSIAALQEELVALRARAEQAVEEAARRGPDVTALHEELSTLAGEMREQAIRAARDREDMRRRLEERSADEDERSRRTERDLRELRDELGRREAELRAAREQTDATGVELRTVREELEGTVRELRRARSDIETATSEARHAREDLDRALRDRGGEAELKTLVETLRETLAGKDREATQAATRTLADARVQAAPEKEPAPPAATPVAAGPTAPVGPRPVPAREAPADYPALRRSVGAIARGVIPAGASIAVVSRGDDELLREIGAGAVHFPQAESGRYAGYHPGSGGVAINHLEELVRSGVHYLLFPGTAYWWFDHYRSLGEYLEDRHHVIWDDAVCRIYDLRAARPARPVEAPGGNGVDILCFPIIDWSFRFQRPQQLASQFARTGHRVLYFKTRFHQQGEEAIVEQIAENVYEVQLPGPDHLNLYEHTLSEKERDRFMDTLDRLRRRLQIADAITFVDLPFWTPLALSSRDRWGWRVVYDCMDDHSGFSTVRPEMLECEDELVRESDLLLTTSHLLYEKMAPKASRTLLLPNAADVDHFSTPTDLKPLAHLPRPIVGYYGAISDWFDTDMILKAALARRDWTFVLVGDTFGADVEGLRALENVHLLGEQPYKTLPSYLQSFDVATIPFLITPLTEATNPVKFYEYLSAGKPVVSVDLPELEPYRDYYYSARDSSTFVRQVERALAENSDELAEDRRGFARRNSWAQRYELLGSALRPAYGKAAIVILSFDNLAYLRLCLESIWQNTMYPNYEVIVVDNASSQPVVDYLLRSAEQEPRLRLILNDENLGFARANNLGLEAAADADYLFLLNDDTIVTRGWLGKMVRYLRDDRIGLIGPVSNWAGNEAKIDVSYSDVGQMPAFAERHMREHAGISFDIPMLAMYCVGMRREVLEKVGYLNERFGIGMFEDDDFSKRVRKAWYRVVCAEDVFIHHWGRASFSRLDEDTYAQLFEQNRKTYEQLWGEEWRPHQHR
jgi:GT2 family glycosyltransferase/glycosyltransferase involved in cell wall biosynthesis/predicted  nucleic acid-binding Zn-ribbon protein